MQTKVDAKIDEIAGSGPSAPESRAALLHRQPTPGSIAAAEEKLGEGAGMQDALDALSRARAADAAGDEAACRQALADAERILSQ